MSGLFIIAESSESTELNLKLVQNGYACTITSDEGDIAEQVAEQSPDLVLMEVDGHSKIKELSHRIKQEQNLPIIALVRREAFRNNNESLLEIDDFMATPCDVSELILRIRRLIYKSNHRDNKELIKCGDLVIDPAKCEVSLASLPVTLTFREYELLKFLASNKGHVFTREALLNKVWGYDYYGGDRTVDVHIRRLRSKIENPSHNYIETLRNIGYKFKEDNSPTFVT